MSFSEISGIVAGIIFAVSAGWYAIDVARHKVTASIATFFMFMVVDVSQLASLIAKHVWGVVPFTTVGLVTSIIICLLALRNKKIYFELPDKIGLIGAMIGFLLWFITKDATINLYVITIVNVTIFMPLIIKSFRRPDLESILPWQLNLLASFILLLTINSSAAVVWIVPARQFVCSLLLNLGLYRGNLKPKKKKELAQRI